MVVVAVSHLPTGMTYGILRPSNVHVPLKKKSYPCPVVSSVLALEFVIPLLSNAVLFFTYSLVTGNLVYLIYFLKCISVLVLCVCVRVHVRVYTQSHV